MGRWKGSPQGPYYDPNDDGPDQVAPPPGMGQNGQPLPQQAQPQQGGQPSIPYNSEGPGGFTGHAQDPNFWQLGGSAPNPNGSPNGVWDRAGDYGGYDPNRPPNMVQPTQSLSGLVQQGSGVMPQYSDGVMIPGSGPYGGDFTPTAQRPGGGAMPPYNGGVMPQFGGTLGSAMNKPSTLSALGGLFNGGNVAKNPSSGIAGAIFNKYPDLFKR